MAAQLLIGRYTGYRLTELYRFRDVIEFEPTAEAAPMKPAAAPKQEVPA